MADFVFNIISHHKTGNDYKSFLELLKSYPQTINKKYDGLFIHEAFVKNDYKENAFEFPELSLTGKKDKNIEKKYDEHISLNTEKNNLLEYMLHNKNDLNINYEIFNQMVRQHYLCSGFALKFVNQNIFENQEVPPLHFAVKNNYYKLVNLLLSSGYNIFNKDKEGKIALYYVQEIETFNILVKYYNFEEKRMSLIYKHCIENIFKNTIIKKRIFLDCMLKHFSKNKLPQDINDAISLLFVTESKDKLIRKYAHIFSNDHDDNAMLDNHIFPLAFGSLFFINNSSNLNYKGMLYYQHLKNKQTIPGIKDGFLAHLAFFSDSNNMKPSAFFKPESDKKFTFMSFFHEEYKDKTYNIFIEHLAKTFNFFKDNISVNNTISYHYSIHTVFEKHFKVTSSNPLPPFFNKSWTVDDDFLENLICVFDLHRESNFYLAKHYIYKKENKLKDNTYYGYFSDSGYDKIILKYILERHGNSLKSSTFLKIIKYCFKQCELIALYSKNYNRHEKHISILSFIINICLNKLDPLDIDSLSLNEELYIEQLFNAGIDNVNLTGVIKENKYFSLTGSSTGMEKIKYENKINRI